MDNPTTGNSNSGESSHYFDASPTTPSHKHQFLLHVGTTTLTLHTDQGVFSSHGLDKGTAVLLNWVRDHSVATPPPGAFLCDVGCGSGAIALTMAVLFPQCTIYALDINERARQLCAENARLNDLKNIIVVHPDEVPGDVEFSLLWSNPPIRIGKNELHQLLLRWVSRLTSDGHAHLVVNKNLGADSLTTWLNGQGFPTIKRASSKGFRILEVTAAIRYERRD